MDALIVVAGIAVGTFIMTGMYSVFETLYWKYIDWKYGDD